MGRGKSLTAGYFTLSIGGTLSEYIMIGYATKDVMQRITRVEEQEKREGKQRLCPDARQLGLVEKSRELGECLSLPIPLLYELTNVDWDNKRGTLYLDFYRRVGEYPVNNDSYHVSFDDFTLEPLSYYCKRIPIDYPNRVTLNKEQAILKAKEFVRSHWPAGFGPNGQYEEATRWGKEGPPNDPVMLKVVQPTFGLPGSGEDLTEEQCAITQKELRLAFCVPLFYVEAEYPEMNYQEKEMLWVWVDADTGVILGGDGVWPGGKMIEPWRE
jgi:hypothetical protein